MSFRCWHGDVQTKAEIQKRLTNTEAKRAKIKELVGQGKSLDEIRAAVGDPAQRQGRGSNFPSFTPAGPARGIRYVTLAQFKIVNLTKGSIERLTR